MRKCLSAILTKLNEDETSREIEQGQVMMEELKGMIEQGQTKVEIRKGVIERSHRRE
jgi:hypothetical protein